MSTYSESTSFTTLDGLRTEHVFYTYCALITGLTTTGSSVSTSLGTYPVQYYRDHEPEIQQTSYIMVVHQVTEFLNEANCARSFQCENSVNPNPDIAGLGVRFFTV